MKPTIARALYSPTPHLVCREAPSLPALLAVISDRTRLLDWLSEYTPQEQARLARAYAPLAGKTTTAVLDDWNTLAFEASLQSDRQLTVTTGAFVWNPGMFTIHICVNGKPLCGGVVGETTIGPTTTAVNRVCRRCMAAGSVTEL